MNKLPNGAFTDNRNASLINASSEPERVRRDSSLGAAMISSSDFPLWRITFHYVQGMIPAYPQSSLAEAEQRSLVNELLHVKA